MKKKLLYLANRSRSDVKLGVKLFCTRVKYPDKYYWKNPTWVMIYIKSAMQIPLIIGIGNTNMFWWYIDAAFGLHNYMNSHTVMMMIMGQRSAR